jgi:diguanylate cyclase (GGDEF)-like protein
MELTQKRKVTRATLQALLIISAILAIVMMAYSVLGLRSASSRGGQLESFADDWRVLSGVSSKRVSLPKGVELTGTGTLALENMLPSTVTDSDVLCVTVNHQNLNVQVDGVTIYNYESRGTIGQFVGRSYCFVPLTSDMAGKKITLNFSTFEHVSTTYVEQPRIGGSDAIYRQLLKDNSFAVVTSAFFLIFGIGLLVTLVVMSRQGIKQNRIAICMMGVFLILSALYELYQTGIPAFMFDQEGLIYVLGCSTQLLLLVPLLIYFTEVLNFKHPLLSLVCVLSMMNFIVQCIIYLSGAADFGNMEIINLLLWVFESIYLTGILLIEFVKYQRHEVRLLLAAMVLFTIMVVTDALFDFFFPERSTRVFDSLCTVIYQLLLVADVLKLVAGSMQEYMEQKLGNQMAFLDGLTRMANRSSYNRHLDRLSDHQDHDLTVAVVDIRMNLDELMQTNEKQGYNAGDEMVLGCAECVNRAFKNMGRCYRISGNEFVAILEQHTEEEVQTSVEGFIRTIHDFNNEHVNPLHLRLGYGMQTGIMTKAKLLELVEKTVASAEELK